MKKIKNTLMAVITVLAAIVMLIGAASMDSESILIPVMMLFGGLFVVAITNKLYWHVS